jgi:hypothetical protein
MTAVADIAHCDHYGYADTVGYDADGQLYEHYQNIPCGKMDRMHKAIAGYKGIGRFAIGPAWVPGDVYPGVVEEVGYKGLYMWSVDTDDWWRYYNGQRDNSLWSRILAFYR